MLSFFLCKTANIHLGTSERIKQCRCSGEKVFLSCCLSKKSGTRKLLIRWGRLKTWGRKQKITQGLILNEIITKIHTKFMRIWLHFWILKDTPKSRLNIGNTEHLLFQKSNGYCSCSAALEKEKELPRVILVLFIIQRVKEVVKISANLSQTMTITVSEQSTLKWVEL